MWYKQEGELVPFTAWPWMGTVTRLSPQFKHHFVRLQGYFHKQYGVFYWDVKAMKTLSRFVYETYGKDINKIYHPFQEKADNVEKIYIRSFAEDFTTYTPRKLLAFYTELWGIYTSMWASSLFIDSFDPGYDQDEIERLARHYGVTMPEACILTTPIELTYVNERKLDFLGIVLTIGKNIPLTHPLLKEHIRKYDFYQFSYAVPKHITPEQIAAELKEDPVVMEQEREMLLSYTPNQEQKINAILQQHNLTQNPLHFFQKLTFWREHRKKVNMMGCYIMHRFLQAVQERTNIPKEHLEYLNFDEMEPLLRGKISAETLCHRYEHNVLISIKQNGYTIITGTEAKKIKDQLEERIPTAVGGQIRGKTANWGKVQGRVKIIIDRKDFETFKEGDILVAGMTRPEHVPLMKKAAAIVTNEGGITCHAAIMSRELGKPCIIGTKVATEVLKNGDLVEVNANHGVVRKL